jgi:CubicO group peptidase (beta-lactamase class C family)
MIVKSKHQTGFWNISGSEWERDIITPLWSMSKALTAIGIIKLLEESKLELDDLVSKYVPEFKTPQVCSEIKDDKCVLVDAESEITIRQCITHTSGLS